MGDITFLFVTNSRCFHVHVHEFSAKEIASSTTNSKAAPERKLGENCPGELERRVCASGSFSPQAPLIPKQTFLFVRVYILYRLSHLVVDYQS